MQLAEVSDPALTAELHRYTTDYYPAYEDGHLLEAGGWSDQPARYATLIRALKHWDERVSAKYVEITKANAAEQ
jgi:hypothetical protein